MSRSTVGIVISRPRHSRRGFTLAEMLVVVGVTALLISIVLPSVNAARKHAERVACAANLRSIGQAYHIYANEYKGEYAPQNYDIWPNGPWGTPLSGPVDAPDGPAIVLAMGHFQDPRILYCPSADEDPGGNDTAAGYIAGVYDGRQTSNLDFWTRAKRTNEYLGDQTGNQTGYAFWINQDLRFDRGAREREWFARFKDDPADRVMASDHMTRGVAGDRWTGHKVDSKRRVVQTQPLPGFPTDPDPDLTVNYEGGNVLYNDGHVEWKSTNDAVYRFSDPDGDYDVFW